MQQTCGHNVGKAPWKEASTIANQLFVIGMRKALELQSAEAITPHHIPAHCWLFSIKAAQNASIEG